MCRTGWRAEFDCLCHETSEDWEEENVDSDVDLTANPPDDGLDVVAYDPKIEEVIKNHLIPDPWHEATMHLPDIEPPF